MSIKKIMIENILQLLELAKEKKVNGEFIDIALGKYKLPMSIKEGLTQYKMRLWQK